MEPIALWWRWLGVIVSASRRDQSPAAPVGRRTSTDSVVVSLSIPARDFDTFYRAHRDEIARALVFTLGDTTLGQEAVDEAMARAYQRWDQLAATENPAGWVYVVGRRWGLSWKRGRRRERRREQLVADLSDVADPATLEYIDLMRALSELSIDHRSVVVCRFSLGMSVRETAELLDVSEGTVKSRLSRSIDRLRTLIEEDA